MSATDPAGPGGDASPGDAWIAAYLDRIGHAGPVPATAASLAALSAAHTVAVPFENLDIVPLGRRIDLAPDALVAKVVSRRRGGFCYELNGLFALLLERLGYGVDRLAMRFVREDGGLGPERDHLTLLVTVPPGAPSAEDGARFLVDVGAGRHSLATPIRLDDGGDQPHPADGATHRIVPPGAADPTGARGDHGDWQLWRRPAGEEWAPLYRFALTPHRLADFAAACARQQTAPDSTFIHFPICTRRTLTGRVTLRDQTLTVTDGAARVERTLSRSEEVRAALRDHFGVDLDAPGPSGFPDVALAAGALRLSNGRPVASGP